MIVVGCNYHTKWQSDKRMRFVLKEVKNGKARLATRRTRKNFWTNLDDLIFIESKHNIEKAEFIKKHGNESTLIRVKRRKNEKRHI